MTTLLVTFANVNLFGSCSVGLFDTESHHFCWLDRTGYVDINSVIRAVRHNDEVVILYRNSAGSKRLLLLDKNLTVRYSHADAITSEINDIFSDENEIYAICGHRIYLLHIESHPCRLTLERLIDTPPGARTIKFVLREGQLIYASARQELHENRKFAVAVRLVSDCALPVSLAALDSVSELAVVDGALFVANASASSLLRISRDRLTQVEFPRGYVRGIAAVPSGYFVGTGGWRYTVRKFGKRLHPGWVSRTDYYASYSSQIHRLDDDLQVMETLDISHLGREISSLVTVPSWTTPITSLDTHRAASRRANYSNELARTLILAEIEAGK